MMARSTSARARPASVRVSARCWCRSSCTIRTAARGDQVVYERSQHRGSRRTPAIPPARARRSSPARPAAAPACCCRDAMASTARSATSIGQEFYGEYLAKTDPLGADVPNPVSPRRLRLRHADVHPRQEDRQDQQDGRRARRRQGHQPAVLRRADRGRRRHEHGLRPDGAVSRSTTTASPRQNTARSACSARIRSRRSRPSSSTSRD